MDAMSPENDPHPEGIPKRRTPWNTLEGRVISLVSRKGGVGKTTSAVNLGAAFALSGHSVLIVGTDPQCGVCRTLGHSPDDLTGGLMEVFNGAGSMTDLAQPTLLPGLFFISPNVLSLQEEEMFMQHMDRRSDVFATEIDRARNLYDTVIIDCPPSLGPATQAALLASDSFLVPVQAEELSRNSIEPLLEYVEAFRERYYPVLEYEGAPAARIVPLNLEGLFLTMASERTRICRHVTTRVTEEFGPWLLDCGIPRNTRISEMALRGQPAVIFDRRSKGSRAYFDLADEIVRRFLTGSTRPLASREGATAPEGSQKNPSNDQEDEGIGGLDRFLGALAEGVAGPTMPAAPDTIRPDMVSLDELLAEEEERSHSRGRSWDEWGSGWPAEEPDSDRRFN